MEENYCLMRETEGSLDLQDTEDRTALSWAAIGRFTMYKDMVYPGRVLNSDIGSQPEIVAWVGGSICCICSATEIPFMYSFSGNCASLVRISTFMYLWVIYIFPESVHIFSCSRICNRGNIHINRSQTYDCGNWDCGRAIPFLGIFVWIFGIVSLQCGYANRTDETKLGGQKNFQAETHKMCIFVTKP